MTRHEADAIARSHLEGFRLEHSLSVATLAGEMGRAFGLDDDALSVAGVLHDIAKPMDPDRQRVLALAWHDAQPESVWSETPALWHAPAAAWLLVHEYGLDDQRIVQAIVRHTTGCNGMTRFDECLYAADFLDPVRVFDGQSVVWTLIRTDFDAGLLEMCRQTILSVVERGRTLDQASVAYYNEIAGRLADPGHLPRGFTYQGAAHV
ncbi:MAG TPA: bis(5'-nucleosyl)-tetraphosphatase (symmetrical) YqeK [Spirochaetota bacterium]|nr:bis(5'-nucleosyl)-tetraphosphatase (symmetrical) YqeK [Spirochaetota bacterium]